MGIDARGLESTAKHAGDGPVFGCIPDVLASVTVDRVHDRGKSYVSTFYDAYVKAVKNKRMTAEVGEKIILDKDSANPVTIALYVVNANGNYQ